MAKGGRFREKSSYSAGPTYVGNLKNTTKWNNGTTTVDLNQNYYTTSGMHLRYVKRVWDETHPGPPYRTGGPFTMIEGEYPHNSVIGHGTWSRTFPVPGGVRTSTYSGGFAPSSFPWGGPTEAQVNAIGLSLPYSTSWFDATSYGSQAWLSARPKLEKVDLGVAIGELKDLPRMLKTTAKLFHDIWKDMGGSLTSMVMQPRKVADNFLNHQFGWVPFVGDIIRTYDTYQNQRKYLDQLTKDNNTWIRRRRVISETSSNTRTYRGYSPWSIPYSYISGLLDLRVIDGNNARGLIDVYKVLYELVYFVGAFKYYRPEFDRTKPWFNSKYGDIMRICTLYGLRVSPTTIWKLTPWSWLIDWFSNAGKEIEYATALGYDNLLSRYAYTMRTRREAHQYIDTYFMPNGNVASHSWVVHVNSKDRAKAASPFGFDLSWDNLNPRQLAILAALGITRFH